MPQTDPFPVLCYAGNVECVHLNYFTSNLRDLRKDCQPLLQALSLLPSSMTNEETLWCYICNIKLAITGLSQLPSMLVLLVYKKLHDVQGFTNINAIIYSYIHCAVQQHKRNLR